MKHEVVLLPRLSQAAHRLLQEHKEDGLLVPHSHQEALASHERPPQGTMGTGRGCLIY